jgi:hypothetical protein
MHVCGCVFFICVCAHACRTADQYDNIVCAELCDDSTDENRELQRLQLKFMIHRCHDGCFAEDDVRHKTCLKGYPREFRNETIDGDDSYPQYRRRSPSDGGVQVETRNGIIDNRHVVPTNLWLLKK